MKITAIERQQKQTNRYSVFVDKKYSFSLTQQQLIDFKIKLDQEIDEQDLDNFRQESVFGKYYERTLRYLALRLRSEKEIVNYLKKIGVNQDAMRKIVEKLKDYKYIDDTKFAMTFVSEKRKIKSASQRQIVFELKQKGVEAEVIDKAIRECELDETSAINDLINKKRRIKRYQDDQKLKQYLAGKGFSYETILRALDQDSTEV